MFNSVTNSANKAGGGKDAQYKAMFDQMDKDGSGTIDRDELINFTKGMIPESSLNTVVGFVDKSGDGKIDFNEFKSFMKKVEKIKKFLPM